MSKNLFALHPVIFFLFMVLGQSQLGFGQDEDDDESSVSPLSFKSVSSLFFQPGTNYNVFVSVNPNPTKEPLQLKCVLMANSNNESTIESEPVSLLPGESGQISIPLTKEMPGNETKWRLFVWSITEDSGTNGYLSEAPHTLIFSSEANAERQSLSKADLTEVFIQTDKPIYKPDDLVRLRVITMSTNNLPYLTAGVNVTITDSQGNVMKKWEQPIELPSNISTSRTDSVAVFGEFQKKKNGLSAYEYQLSSEPILGKWTIEVQAGNIKEKMSFDVKQFILPKFQVKIHVPLVVYGTGDVKAVASIRVSYTYGKGLQGTGTLNVTSYYSAPRLQQFQVKDGEAEVSLTLNNPYGYNVQHTIIANVTEKNTGRWITATATVSTAPQEKFYIRWINQPRLYKPGFPINVQLKITDPYGFPVKEVQSNTLKITFPPSLNVNATEAPISLNGIFTFFFPTPLEPLPDRSQFQIQYKNSMRSFTLPPAASGTSSGIFIDLIPPPDDAHLIQGNSYNFTIRSNKPIEPREFHCLLWDDSTKEVNGAQVIKNSHKKEATQFPFSLQLPKAAYTELKIFVYFEKKEVGQTEIISTSKSINTHNYLKIRVLKPIPKKSPAVAPAPETPVETTPDSTTANTTEGSDYEVLAEDIPSDDQEDNQRDDPAAEPQSTISSKLQVKPGDAVEIHFETYPDSTIAIRGIDQSLLLLTEQDNDLDAEKIKEKRRYSSARQFFFDSIPLENSTFLKAFHLLGIAILSSETFDPFVKEVAGVSVGDNENTEESDVAPSDNSILDDAKIPEVDTRLRTKFPETWLWEDFQSSNDSSITVLSKTLPDTLTSWIISGFSLNPKTGLGVASSATVTGFMQFFVTLNMPYSVMKLEAFDLQVIVHNYLDRNVDVFVTLSNKQDNSDFSFVDGRDQKSGNATRSINVAKNHAAVAHFLIIPMVIGDIPLEVKAVTEDGSAGDSMIRHLKVKPDGVMETKSELVIFEVKTGDQNQSREASFDVDFPSKVVKDASSLQLTVFGDYMGTMVANLGHLISLPYGCGYQNMMPFMANVLTINYLSATNSNDTATIQKAKNHLEKTYAYQLQFKTSDGAFAVSRGGTGCTWLTAYVLRWFLVAQKYITIDPKVITGAASFIQRSQQSNGAFNDGQGFNIRESSGETDYSGVALSAYITLAFIKASETHNDLDLKVAIQNGMNFISRGSVYQLDDNYITNLVTATLMAGNHPEKDRFFEKMENGANTTTTRAGVKFKYWSLRNSRELAYAPLAIEMTSYALLAHLWRNNQTDLSILNIHRWLLSQRNSYGGFISTQDTAIGLTALAEFALKRKTNTANVRDEDELQLNIKASSNSPIVNDTELSLSIGRWNRMVVHEFTLPATTKKVKVHARGNGPALLQMTKTWHVPIKDKFTRNPPDHFNVTAKMRIPDPEKTTETELEVCANSYHLNGAKDAIASINLPSGYAFSPGDYENGTDFMASRPENVHRFELREGNTVMHIYYTSVPAHPPTCTTLAATQLIRVAHATNPLLRVYEYDDPSRKATIVYLPAHDITVCKLCRDSGLCKREECD